MNTNIVNPEIEKLQLEIGRINIELQKEKNEHKNDIQVKDNEINNLNLNFSSHQNQLQTQITEKNIEINALKTKHSQELKERDSIILNKLSEGYNAFVVKDIVPERIAWLKKTKISFVLLAIVFLITAVVYFSLNLDLGKKIVLFSFDTLMVSLLWFCVNQYSYYTKLFIEYSNRKVVASSYLSITENTNDHVIKTEASKIIINTLFSKSSSGGNVELPLVEAIKIVNNLKDKI